MKRIRFGWMKSGKTDEAKSGHPEPPSPAASCPVTTFPLALACEGETVTIITIRSGCNVQSRLLSMGLQTNDIVTVIHKHPNGATIIEKSGSRIALGGGMALKINVIRYAS